MRKNIRKRMAEGVERRGVRGRQKWWKQDEGEDIGGEEQEEEEGRGEGAANPVRQNEDRRSQPRPMLRNR